MTDDRTHPGENTTENALRDALHHCASDVSPNLAIRPDTLRRARSRERKTAVVALTLALIVAGGAVSFALHARPTHLAINVQQGTPDGLVNLPDEITTRDECGHWRKALTPPSDESQTIERRIYEYGYCSVPDEFGGAEKSGQRWVVRFTANLAQHRSALEARGIPAEAFVLEEVPYSLRYSLRVANAVNRDALLLKGKGIALVSVGGYPRPVVTVQDLTAEEREYLEDRYGDAIQVVSGTPPSDASDKTPQT